MKLKIIMINIVTAGLCFLSLTCKSLTGPDDNAQPGSRNYVWTTDTLPTMWQNSLGGIWGSSPMDVWSGGFKDLFHYDGKAWSRWTIAGCEVNTIFGFGANDVWIGCNSGKIWHFDGSQWTENFVYRPDGLSNVSISNIYGVSANDVYAVGGIVYNSSTQRAFILHYNGSGWEEVYKSNVQSWFIRIRVEDGIAYLFGEQVDFSLGGDTVLGTTGLLYQYQDRILRQIYSISENKSWTMIDGIGGRVYFIFSHDVCRYDQPNSYLITGSNFGQGTFVKQFSIDDPKFDYQVYGRSEKDIFVGMQDGVAHYNGSDLQYLFRFSGNFTYSPVPAIFEKDVFFRIDDGLNGVITAVHGKLVN